jgi:hypothetical protein
MEDPLATLRELEVVSDDSSVSLWNMEWHLLFLVWSFG